MTRRKAESLPRMLLASRSEREREQKHTLNVLPQGIGSLPFMGKERGSLK